MTFAASEFHGYYQLELASFGFTYMPKGSKQLSRMPTTNSS